MTQADIVQYIRRALAGPPDPSSDFDLNPEISLPAGRKLRDAAVLIPIQHTVSGAQIILTVRSSNLIHHPGQIAFPGGKVDQSDGGFVQAALREAREEIGLESNKIEILGSLSTHETVTGFNVVPVIGCITSDFAPVSDPNEVEEVFTVPLDFLCNPGNFHKQSRIWQGAPRYYYTVPYGPYYIWGATARILYGLAQRLAL